MTVNTAFATAETPSGSVDLDPGLMKVLEQSEALVEVMAGFFARLDRNRSKDFEDIAADIRRAVEDIHAIRPRDITHEGIPKAGAELEAITRDTETATNTIMSAAEAMMDMRATAPNLKDLVDDEVMKIFEACSFQDITGQRVSKIVTVLSQIESRIAQMALAFPAEDTAPAALTAEEIRQRDLILNGPGIDGPETEQALIDALFD